MTASLPYLRMRLGGMRGVGGWGVEGIWNPHELIGHGCYLSFVKRPPSKCASPNQGREDALKKRYYDFLGLPLHHAFLQPPQYITLLGSRQTRMETMRRSMQRSKRSACGRASGRSRSDCMPKSRGERGFTWRVFKKGYFCCCCGGCGWRLWTFSGLCSQDISHDFLQVISQPMLKFGTDRPLPGKFRCEQYVKTQSHPSTICCI